MHSSASSASLNIIIVRVVKELQKFLKNKDIPCAWSGEVSFKKSAAWAIN